MATNMDAGNWRRRMRQLLHQDQRDLRDEVRPGCACGDPSCRALVPLIPAPRDPIELFSPTGD
ncbi:MAG: hypothetical protein ACJ73S_25030 [Mycobacteriales bacterium]|jgi:hypothetical protein